MWHQLLGRVGKEGHRSCLLQAGGARLNQRNTEVFTVREYKMWGLKGSLGWLGLEHWEGVWGVGSLRVTRES